MSERWKEYLWRGCVGCGLTLMLISLIRAEPRLWPWQLVVVGYAALCGAVMARRPKE